MRSCSDACTSGERQCSGDGYQTCKKQSSGCYDWSDVVACQTNYTCENGSCVKSCTDACTSGSRQCSGNGYQTCKKASSGCYEWSDITDCQEGYACSNGSCVKSCSDECETGEKRCSGNGVQTCGNYDYDSCREWSQTSACSTGYTCENGSCVKSCSDECTAGEKQCAGNGVQTCKKQSSGCYDWSDVVECASGKICENGSCVTTCTDKCTDGEHECSGTSGRTCGYNSGNCTSWGTYQKCDDQCYSCGDGTCNSSCGETKSNCSDDCGTVCTDECESGDKKCSGNTSYQVCGNYDSDACTEWGSAKQCGSNKKCSGGECVTSCTDKCTDGAHECSGTSGRTCAYSGECTVWGAYEKCDTKCYSCGDGTCNSSCGETKSNCSQDCGSEKPTVDLTGPSKVACKKEFTLNWTSTNAENCTASGGWSGSKDTSGSEVITAPESTKSYKLTCTGGGGSASDSISVSVTKTKPDANAGEDREVDEGDSVMIDGGGSSENDDNLTYFWKCNGGVLSDSGTANPDFTAPEVTRDTIYVCTLKVTNDCALSDSDTMNVRVRNRGIQSFDAELDAEPASGCAPLNNVDLTARVTNIDNGGNDEIFIYSFDCDSDGDWDKTTTSSQTEYTATGLCDYGTDGTFTARVKIENAESGHSATDTASVKAKDCAASEFTVTLTASPDSGCKPLENVDLKAKVYGLDEDDDDYEFTYSFDCDSDGDWDKVIDSSLKEYTAKDLCDYKTAGTKTAKVKVKRSSDGREASDTASVSAESCEIEDFTVSLEANPDSGCKPLNNVDLSANIDIDDSNDDDFTYSFDCENDGDWDKVQTTSDTDYTAHDLCDYKKAKTYTAKVKVKNNGSGKTATDTVSIRAKSCEDEEEEEENGDIEVEKTVANISSNGKYGDSASAKPGDTLSFRIRVRAVSGDVRDVTVMDDLPEGLVDPADVEVDGDEVDSDLSDSIEIGDIDDGDTVEITFTARVQRSSFFSYGQTTLVNTARARSKDGNDSDTAQISVSRREVEGATTISTGLTDNPFLDSFAIPLGLSLLFAWALKAKLLKAEEWLDATRVAYAKYSSSKALGAKVASVKAKRSFSRLFK